MSENKETMPDAVSKPPENGIVPNPVDRTLDSGAGEVSTFSMDQLTGRQASRWKTISAVMIVLLILITIAGVAFGGYFVSSRDKEIGELKEQVTALQSENDQLEHISDNPDDSGDDIADNPTDPGQTYLELPEFGLRAALSQTTIDQIQVDYIEEQKSYTFDLACSTVGTKYHGEAGAGHLGKFSSSEMHTSLLNAITAAGGTSGQGFYGSGTIVFGDEFYVYRSPQTPSCPDLEYASYAGIWEEFDAAMKKLASYNP